MTHRGPFQPLSFCDLPQSNSLQDTGVYWEDSKTEIIAIVKLAQKLWTIFGMI